jgi:hypothetical protein
MIIGKFEIMVRNHMLLIIDVKATIVFVNIAFLKAFSINKYYRVGEGGGRVQTVSNSKKSTRPSTYFLVTFFMHKEELLK